MDIKKLIKDHNLSGFPVGASRCSVTDFNVDSCGYDVFVFDDKLEQKKIISFDNSFAVIHHASLSETSSHHLLQYEDLEIIFDESWDLRMLLSKIHRTRSYLYFDFAKNCLIESIFCCQKAKKSLLISNVFAHCWQKCAAYYLADAISSINSSKVDPSRMLDFLRKLEKNQINEHISTITDTVGFERATPTLLQRMMKSSIGFSDLVENNGHSALIRQKYNFFLRNSMLSDCYFYLGYMNKENFVKIQDMLHQDPSFAHILKIAFDVEADVDLIGRQSDIIQKSCNDILEILSTR